MSKKLSLEEFIRLSMEKHGDKYDYSKCVYNGATNKVEIICKRHGSIFSQYPYNHMRGSGCPKCSEKEKHTTSSYIEKAEKIHNYKYDYSLLEYVNLKTNVKIICKKHGMFEMQAAHHLHRKSGCIQCLRRDNENFIIDAKKIHGDTYDYSLSNYVGVDDKLKIICRKHGVFEQKCYSHLEGAGCPSCKKFHSRGEMKICKLLDYKNISYIRQKKFPECRNILPLPFDFYLPDYNSCIEYDGVVHYTGWMGDTKNREMIQKRDNIKTNFCQQNNINLLRISYIEFDNIDLIIDNFLYNL